MGISLSQLGNTLIIKENTLESIDAAIQILQHSEQLNELQFDKPITGANLSRPLTQHLIAQLNKTHVTKLVLKGDYSRYPEDLWWIHQVFEKDQQIQHYDVPNVSWQSPSSYRMIDARATFKQLADRNQALKVAIQPFKVKEIQASPQSTLLAFFQFIFQTIKKLYAHWYGQPVDHTSEDTLDRENTKREVYDLMRYPYLTEVLSDYERIQAFKEKDYYRVLGLKECAHDEAIREAWRKLSLYYHPDKGNFSVIEPAIMLQRIAQAKERLLQPELEQDFVIRGYLNYFQKARKVFKESFDLHESLKQRELEIEELKRELAKYENTGSDHNDDVDESTEVVSSEGQAADRKEETLVNAQGWYSFFPFSNKLSNLKNFLGTFLQPTFSMTNEEKKSLLTQNKNNNPNFRS